MMDLSEINEWMWHRRIDRHGQSGSRGPPISLGALALGRGSALWVCGHIALELLLSSCRQSVWQWRMRMLAFATPTCPDRGRNMGTQHQAASAKSTEESWHPMETAGGWWWPLIEICCIMLGLGPPTLFRMLGNVLVRCSLHLIVNKMVLQ